MNTNSVATLKGDQRSHGSAITRRSLNVITVIVFLLPAFFFFAFFIIYPILQAIFYSFFNWKGLGPATDFVGLNNYVRIFGDPVFLKAVGNGLLIVFLSLFLQLPLSIGLAIMVRHEMPGRIFFRTVFFLPYVFSEVITGIIWATLFKPDPQVGLLNAIITLIPGASPLTFLGSTDMVMGCIFVALTWKYFGFHMLLFMTGLANIPQEIEEAATIDGANSRQILTHITLPLLSSTLRTSIYISVLGSLQQFGLVWIMSQGGPVSASETMATYMYRYGFVRMSLGYGCAVAVVLLLICMAFSIAYQRLVPQEDYLGGISM